MLNRLQKSMAEKDRGFTLIELLVVIVIIGILAGIAIPVFLSQRKKGVDSGTESDLKSLATIQETYFVDANAYTTDKAKLSTAGWNPTEGNKIGVFLGTGDSLGKYCIQGFNTGGSMNSATNAYYYASDAGGLSKSKKGICASASGFESVIPAAATTPAAGGN